ncbi:MAG: hypothetical protein ACXADY_10275 [Candidatus Hodarchaeales archaeon]
MKQNLLFLLIIFFLFGLYPSSNDGISSYPMKYRSVDSVDFSITGFDVSYSPDIPGVFRFSFTIQNTGSDHVTSTKQV